MKLVTCIGATSGRNWITTGPLFVCIFAKYLCAGSKATFSGLGSRVFQPSLVLSTAALAICASMAEIALSETLIAALTARARPWLAGGGLVAGAVPVVGGVVLSPAMAALATTQGEKYAEECPHSILRWITQTAGSRFQCRDTSFPAVRGGCLLRCGAYLHAGKRRGSREIARTVRASSCLSERPGAPPRRPAWRSAEWSGGRPCPRRRGRTE